MNKSIQEQIQHDPRKVVWDRVLNPVQKMGNNIDLLVGEDQDTFVWDRAFDEVERLVVEIEMAIYTQTEQNAHFGAISMTGEQ